MTAEEIARSLGGRNAGESWVAHCPAHDDHTPSLAVCDGQDGQPLVHCHAGCSQTQVIDALRRRGMWGTERQCHYPLGRPAPRRAAAVRDDTKRTAAALAIWKSAVPAGGTLAETYLASRGLQLSAVLGVLRFHPALKHTTQGVWPAMVALVTRGTDNTPMAVHRTFLARDGSSKAPVTPSKMMLGPCRGGAARLGSLSDTLMVGEGIETCLAAMVATGVPAWAALSTSGLRTLDLPDAVREVTILADGDDAGEAAAQSAAQRWQRCGRRVRIARAPRGTDFNDVLVDSTLMNVDSTLMNKGAGHEQ